MRDLWNFIKTTMLGGVVFLLPIAAVLVIVVKAGKIAIDAATPLAEKLPIPKPEAVLVVYIIGAILLVIMSFAAGFLTRVIAVKAPVSFLEDRILNRFPPYVAVRKHADRLVGIETNENLSPVLVRVYNGWQVGFVVDAFSDGHAAVFIPGAPDPSSGIVQIISSENITPANVSRADILACLEKSGRGLPELLSKSPLVGNPPTAEA